MYYCIEPRRGTQTRFHAFTSAKERDDYAKHHVSVAYAMPAREVRRRMICDVFNGYSCREGLLLSKRYGSFGKAKKSASMQELFDAAISERQISEVIRHGHPATHQV